MNNELLGQIKGLRTGKHSFQTIKKTIGEDRLREFINSIYPKFTITEIETITGIPDSTLARWFEQLNIPFIRHHIKTRAFPSNVNSEVVVTKEGITYNSATINMTPELAYIIGFTLGDGSVQQYMIEVFNKDRKLREILFNYLKPYGTITEEERPNGLWRLRLSNGRIANLIKDQKVIRKDTVNYIFKDGELVKRFIAAFWDAEGSIGRRKNTKRYFDIILYNSNEHLLSKIRKTLNNFGINTSLKHFKETRKNYFIDKQKVQAKKRVLRIRILKDSLFRWASIIGVNMVHSKKRENVNDIIKLYGGN